MKTRDTFNKIYTAAKNKDEKTLLRLTIQQDTYDTPIEKRNRKIRLNSQEEKIFAMNAVAGFLSLWKPCPNQKEGLPLDTGKTVGDFFNRLEAIPFIKVCNTSYKTACAARKKFIDDNKGELTYEQESITYVDSRGLLKKR